MSTQSSRSLRQSSDGFKDHRRKKEVSNSSPHRIPSRKAPNTEIKTSTRCKENILQENDKAPHPDSAKNLEAKEEAKTQSMLNDLTILHKKKERELRARFERVLEKEREARDQVEHDMSNKQQQEMKKWKATMSANFQIEYNKAIDLNEREMESIINKFKLETEAKIQLGVDKVMSNTLQIANFPTNKFGPIVSVLSNPHDTWVTICSVYVSTSPWRIRTSQNQAMQLGENGQFMVQRNIVTQVRRVVYFVRGEVTFMAKCPDSKPWTVLQGNAGKSQICWEAINYAHTAGGTTIKGAEGLMQVAAARRFFFQFNDNASLSVVLYHMFYSSQKLLTQFFQATTLNMFTQERFYHPPSTPQQRKDENGGVDYYGESQL